MDTTDNGANGTTDDDGEGQPGNGGAGGENGRPMPRALTLLASERPRNLNWFQAGSLLFGDWGTSRLYVLGLAFLVAGRSSLWLIAAMSLLLLVVGWAYTHICRLYPDGGGVYTAGRRRAALLGVIGALLLFADYTITASLSAVEAFHYFGLGTHAEQVEAEHRTAEDTAEGLPPSEAGDVTERTPVEEEVAEAEAAITGTETPAEQAARASPGPRVVDPGDEIILPHAEGHIAQEPLFTWPPSPGLYAILAILLIGCFNLMGPKHTAGYAIFAAGGMIAITLLVVAFALPQIDWSRLDWGRLTQPPTMMWQGFVYIVLALSGVEAIANLTGVMRKPVYQTARKSIWLVAGEVALFNVLLAVVMISLAVPTDAHPNPIGREQHTEDMLAYMAAVYIGPWGEWLVRIVAGLLLLSATNTAVNGLMSITYVMSRDGELPAVLQRLNGFGAPWICAVVAASVPAIVLLFFHDLRTLASLYAIGVVGAVALDCSLAAVHPRMRRTWRKLAIGLLGLFLVGVWITLAFTKLHALAFVTIVLVGGLALRQATRWAAARRPRPSLLRQAIMDQLTPDALLGPKVMLATAGSDQMAQPALDVAKREHASLVVAFIREVALSYKVEGEARLNLDNDPAAQALFTDFLEHGYRNGVTIIPLYDTGPDPAVLIAEGAAINGVTRVLIGSSRRGVLHQMIKGSFQRRLESLLPEDVRVEVLSPPEPVTAVETGSASEEGERPG